MLCFDSSASLQYAMIMLLFLYKPANLTVLCSAQLRFRVFNIHKFQKNL